MKLRHLIVACILAAAMGTAGTAHAFNPQPDPPTGLLLCEAQPDGTLTLLAFDGFDIRAEVGMSCLGALSMVIRKGQEFDVEWFDGMDGAAKVGIIVVNTKPAEF